MRGDNPLSPRLVSIVGQFTPTCVGTIAHDNLCYHKLTVHPHMRGDNGGGRRNCVKSAVHPHMRGDNSFFIRHSASASGSPPHAWGQSLIVLPRNLIARFTPTCVGTMLSARPCSPGVPVHPHMRGDNVSVPLLSSCPLRFTPTCVGTIYRKPRSMDANAVHPHMRGDNVCISSPLASYAGSPPHAWGQSRRRFPCPPDRRFTPTCVGTMTKRWRTISTRSVHPHMRGDNLY